MNEMRDKKHDHNLDDENDRNSQEKEDPVYLENMYAIEDLPNEDEQLSPEKRE